MNLCLIIDNNMLWLCRPLRRRGFTVYCDGLDFPDVGDVELLELGRKTGCIVVSKDKYFDNKECAIYISHREEWRRNSWELITRIVKHAALARRGRAARTV